MKKRSEDAICPNCEWSGDATGITSCPVCGSNLSLIDSLEEEPTLGRAEARYPEDFLSHIQESDDDLVE